MMCRMSGEAFLQIGIETELRVIGCVHWKMGSLKL